MVQIYNNNKTNSLIFKKMYTTQQTTIEYKDKNRLMVNKCNDITTKYCLNG